jgi:hypothetical protein
MSKQRFRHGQAMSLNAFHVTRKVTEDMILSKKKIEWGIKIIDEKISPQGKKSYLVYSPKWKQPKWKEVLITCDIPFVC